MEFADVNWMAVIGGTIGAFLLGWLIYAPFAFGKVWAEGSGVVMEGPTAPPAFAMVAQLLALFCLSTVVGVTATADWLLTAIIAVLGAGLLVVSNGAFCRKSGYAMGVDFGYALGAGVVMIGAQGIL